MPRSRGSGSPAPSRPGTPQAGRASVRVPMGGMAFLSKTGQCTTITSVGGYRAINSTAAPHPVVVTTKTGSETINEYGILTSGMTSCFTVIVAGKSGAILAHVTAYLGHATLTPTQTAERKAMKDGFKALWDAHRNELTPSTVAIIAGPSTNLSQMTALIAHIFPQIASAAGPNNTWQCDTLPANRTPSHGTAQVMVWPTKEIFVEDKRRM